jgi:hypothetical protein
MKQTQWHGILVDQSFQNKAFLEKYSLFAKEKTATLGWLLYGVKIANTELDETVNPTKIFTLIFIMMKS